MVAVLVVLEQSMELIGKTVPQSRSNSEAEVREHRCPHLDTNGSLSLGNQGTRETSRSVDDINMFGVSSPTMGTFPLNQGSRQKCIGLSSD